jgi:hypothetical protein
VSEQWRAIRGYEGRYEVSSAGRVRSLTFNNGKVRDRPLAAPRILRYSFVGTDKTYRAVCLCAGGVKRTATVHRLVARAFLGDPPREGALVRHLDGNPLNNEVTNLAYGNHTENESDKRRHGRTACGERSFRAKLTDAQVLCIREDFKRGVPPAELAAKHGLCDSSIHKIATGQLWSHLPGAIPKAAFGKRLIKRAFTYRRDESGRKYRVYECAI